ncbi:MAG: hypothetical protein IJP66_10010, partial [Kiritimatiellae bacterium]|nr:hypothetical protein [Kiritimatiellia bacterium]
MFGGVGRRGGGCGAVSSGAPAPAAAGVVEGAFSSGVYGLHPFVKLNYAARTAKFGPQKGKL